MNIEALRKLIGNDDNIVIVPHYDTFVVAYNFPADVWGKAEAIRGTLQTLSLGGRTIQSVIRRCEEVAVEMERRGELETFRPSSEKTVYGGRFVAHSPVPLAGEWISPQASDAWRCVCQMAAQRLDWPECVNFPEEVKFLFQLQSVLRPDTKSLIQAAFGDETSPFPYGVYYVQGTWDTPPQLGPGWCEEHSTPQGIIYRQVENTPDHYRWWSGVLGNGETEG